jgi:hypothetical protein
MIAERGFAFEDDGFRMLRDPGRRRDPRDATADHKDFDTSAHWGSSLQHWRSRRRLSFAF